MIITKQTHGQFVYYRFVSKSNTSHFQAEFRGTSLYPSNQSGISAKQSSVRNYYF